MFGVPVATEPGRRVATGAVAGAPVGQPATARASARLLADLRLAMSLAGTDPAGAESTGGSTGASSPAAGFARPGATPADLERVAALVELAQQGDAEAFGQLYQRYVDTVFRYVYVRVGSRETAEDLTSETFLRALRRIGSFTWQGRDVGAWFVTISRNLIADHYKSGRYRLELTTDDVTDSGAAPVSAGPEAEVLEAMQNKVLLEAVKQLNAEQQECIVLRFLQGLSVSETAEIMGKNDGAIKALQHRAVRKLAELVGEDLQ